MHLVSSSLEAAVLSRKRGVLRNGPCQRTLPEACVGSNAPQWPLSVERSSTTNIPVADATPATTAQDCNGRMLQKPGSWQTHPVVPLKVAVVVRALVDDRLRLLARLSM